MAQPQTLQDYQAMANSGATLENTGENDTISIY